MKIYVKKVDGLTLPKRSSEVAAGYDIIATSDPKITGRRVSNATMEDPVGTERENVFRTIDYIEYETNLFIAPSALTAHTLIHPRSSISKYNLVLANSIGLVDNDYRGMVICRFKYCWQPTDFFQDGNALVGTPQLDKIYKKGDAIAQLVFEPTLNVDFELVDDLSQTARGAGGFGSTDKLVADVKTPITSVIVERYQKAGGVTTKKRYSDEVKERDQQQ